jgi:hypothetical protein
MSDEPILPIFRKLNALDQIVRELPSLGKRSELQEKAREIAILIDEARKAALEMQKEIISLKYDYSAQRFDRGKGFER